METLKSEIRSFVVKNFLFGKEEGLADDSSFLEEGIVDSTGVLELVSHLQETYGIKIDDSELIPDNLDSITTIAEFVTRKRGTAATSASGAVGTA
jgi:acyl carrier protein